MDSQAVKAQSETEDQLAIKDQCRFRECLDRKELRVRKEQLGPGVHQVARVRWEKRVTTVSRDRQDSR